jgi:hypothetical protein
VQDPNQSFGGVGGTAPENYKRQSKNNQLREKSQDASYMRIRKNLINQ